MGPLLDYPPENQIKLNRYIIRIFPSNNLKMDIIILYEIFNNEII